MNHTHKVARIELFHVVVPLPATFRPAWIPGMPSNENRFTLVRITTDDGVEFVRTPDSCFDDLPDFLDRFEDLPRLVNLRNRLARPWTLPPIGDDGLREVIGGPARLAGLDVSEVLEAMVAEAVAIVSAMNKSEAFQSSST